MEEEYIRTLLVLDIGISTGWAYGPVGNPIQWGTLYSVNDLPSISPDIVLGERVAIGNGELGKNLSKLVIEFKNRFPEMLWVNAGFWKPVANFWTVGYRKTKNRHEKDAIRLHLWYAVMKNNVDLSHEF